VKSCTTRPGNNDICRPNLNYTKCGILPICKIIVPVATESAAETGIDLPNTGTAESDGAGMIVGAVIAGILSVCGLSLLTNLIAIIALFIYFLILHKRNKNSGVSDIKNLMEMVSMTWKNEEIQGLGGPADLAFLNLIDKGAFGSVWRGTYNGKYVAVHHCLLFIDVDQEDFCPGKQDQVSIGPDVLTGGINYWDPD
jgi:hypothetical protein